MNLEIISNKLYTNRKWRVTSHMLFWLLLVLVNRYLTTISFDNYNSFSQQRIAALSITGVIDLIIFYYPFVYAVIPRLRKKEWPVGIFAILVLLCVYTLVNTLTETWILLPCDRCMELLKLQHSDYYNYLHGYWVGRFLSKLLSFGIIFGLLFSLSIPLFIKITLQFYRQQLTAIKLAKENVELEFNFLKSQVNQHFLFNSLNNIYGLILKNENNSAAGTVARLCDFMRYTLYNSAGDRMPVEKEIGLLKDYIELERIRMNYTRVEFDIDVDHMNYELPSLLFLPVIENAFKYNADKPETYIKIELLIKSKLLKFNMTNRIDEDRRLQQSGGIGLQNFKKRLGLYYADKHRYQVTTDDICYTVKITIDL